MSASGFDERKYIMSTDKGIGGLCGGRVWRLEVPKKVKIPESGGYPLPYITVHFGTPIATKSGRGFTGEANQPHLMPFQVHVHASTADHLDATCEEVFNRFVGMTPSESGNAGEVSAQGGLPIPRRDDSGAFTRFTHVFYFQVLIGLSGN